MRDQQQKSTVGAALVVGGGIGGMQAALDLAAAGIKVYVAEKQPAIGGVMAQLDKTFPTNDCAMCTQAPRLVEIGRHKDIEVIGLSELQQVSGTPGNFRVTLKKAPRYVDEARCTGCGTCAASCPTHNFVQPLVPAPAQMAPEHRDAVIEIVRKNAGRIGPLMPILQAINATFNYFPAPVLAYVAQQTHTPLSHIYRIATFYNAFSVVPRGKHAISVCMGTTCYVRGSERIMDRFSDVLGVEPEQTTSDMLFTLKSVRCIGCCGLAPAVTVGDAVYGKLTPKDVAGVVAKHRGENQVAATAG